jgi:hypothetical protein
MMSEGLRDSYCEDDAIVIGIAHSFVILNLVQDNKPPWHVILEPKAGRAKTSSG